MAVYVLLSFSIYYKSMFSRFNWTYRLMHRHHTSQIANFFFTGGLYLMPSARFVGIFNLFNNLIHTLEHWLLYKLDFSSVLYIINSFKLFFFNYTYAFSQYFERTNNLLFNFSNYNVDRITSNLVYIKPFNRTSHLVRLFSKSSVFYNSYSRSKAIASILSSLCLNSIAFPASILLSKIQSSVFYNHSGVLFFR